MSEPAASVRGASDLRAFLLNPASAAAPAGWRLAPSALRVGVGVADAVQVILLSQIAASLVPAAGLQLGTTQALGLGALAALLALAIRRALRTGMGRIAIFGQTDWSALRAAVAVVCAIEAVGAVYALASPQSIAATFGDVGGWILSWALGSAAIAAGLRHLAARISAALSEGQRIIVVGAQEQAEALAAAASGTARARWRLVGRMNDRDAGGLDRLVSLLEQRRADVVALAISGPDAAERIAAVCERISDQPVRVCMAFDAASLVHTPRGLSRVGQFALVDLAADPHAGLDGAAKRILDVIGAGALLLALAPVMLAAMVAIRLESPGPVLFRQWRFGLGSRPILVAKFRTMRTDLCDATGAERTTARDPRVTRVGRFLRRTSIDELPQLFNVLRGEMSLVGPRPHPLHMRVAGSYYFEAVERYRARHLVKPGITGWAQINGSRGEVDTLDKAKRRVELDLWYLNNWTLGLDLRILLRTALGGFASPGAD